MRKSIRESLLREYVRQTLNEDDYGGYGGDAYTGGMGVSFGSGQDMVDAFITPFTDVFKTALGQTKEITRKARTVLWVGLQTVLTTLIPFYGYDYADVFDKEKADIEKIRSEYKDVYERTDKALKSNDAALLAFMVSPGLTLGAFAAKNTPKATKSLLSAASGGISDDFYDGTVNLAKKAGRWSLGDTHVDRSAGSSGGGKKEPKDLAWEGQINEDDEEKPKKDITPEKILKSKKMLKKVVNSPKVKEMQAKATEIYKKTLEDLYTKAESSLKKVHTVEDLEKALKGKKGSNKAIEQIDQIKKLPPDEKKKSEDLLIKAFREGSKKFYVENLEKHVKSVMDAGIPAEAQYIKDYKTVIQKIKAL